MQARPLALCLSFAIHLLLSSPSEAQSAKDLETGIRDLAAELSQGMTGQVKKLAVVEFPDLNGYQSTLGQFIAEELITQLSVGKAPNKFDVVERRQLARVLKEQELTDSSLFDAASIAKIGKILGIDAIVTGSIADLGSEVKINARAISIESAKVFTAAATKIAKNDTLQQLMRQSTGPALDNGGVISKSGIPHVIQRSDVYFQNDFLRIEISSAAMSKTKNRLTLSLVFQNTSKEEILLAMVSGYAEACRARVVDNSGIVVPSREYEERVMVTGLHCIDRGEDKAENYTRLSPGAKTPVVLAFESRGEQFGGDRISFSAELLRLTQGGTYSRFTVGLSDVEIRN